MHLEYWRKIRRVPRPSSLSDSVTSSHMRFSSCQIIRVRWHSDAGRHRMERLDPALYLASTYYERWLARMEGAIVAGGTLSREEIEAKIKEFAANPDLSIPRREDPAAADQITVRLRTGN